MRIQRLSRVLLTSFLHQNFLQILASESHHGQYDATCRDGVTSVARLLPPPSSQQLPQSIVRSITMQSFLQYRRFRRHVQTQYERDREKARAIGEGKIHDTSESTSPVSSTVAHAAGDSPIEDPRDPEKGEQATSRGSEGCEVPASAEHAFEPHHSMQPVTTADSRSGMTNTSHVATQGSMGTNLGTALTGINVRDRTTQESRSDPTVHGNKVFVVGYEGDRDSLKPQQLELWHQDLGDGEYCFHRLGSGFCVQCRLGSVGSSQ